MERNIGINEGSKIKWEENGERKEGRKEGRITGRLIGVEKEGETRKEREGDKGKWDR